MGKLVYAETWEIPLDDRTLAHVQIVVGTKLRRQEGFFFSWDDGVEHGGGRGAIWIDQGVALRFRYDHDRMPQISREWLEQLTLSSNSPQGLTLTAEPATARTPPTTASW